MKYLAVFADETDKLRGLAAPACEDLRCSLAVDSVHLFAEELGKATQLLGVLQFSAFETPFLSTTTLNPLGL